MTTATLRIMIHTIFSMIPVSVRYGLACQFVTLGDAFAIRIDSSLTTRAMFALRDVFTAYARKVNIDMGCDVTLHPTEENVTLFFFVADSFSATPTAHSIARCNARKDLVEALASHNPETLLSVLNSKAIEADPLGKPLHEATDVERAMRRAFLEC